MPIFHRKSSPSSSHGSHNHESALHALFGPHPPPSPNSYASNRASRSSSSSGRSGHSGHSGHSHSHRRHHHHHHHGGRHRSNSIFHRRHDGEDEDPSISAARQQVTRAEAMEKEAGKALMASKQAVQEAREHVRRLDREASEEARLARIKQDQVKSISKRAKPLGRSL
ncbi:hypothetical protein BDW42DRAFT_47919 [Aspergillus taichungensis]|uniref:Uncharacterized protein n=1 Tax=Aspergillus taichungensis TaxID=482145 RepID=A0A2J5I303_9EURO|nr:hypothetical protein BDW42DRAFT_47919 [Aspergillus taichungensis]